MNPLNDRVVSRLEPLFRPSSVAIVGASKVPGKIGHFAVSNLIKFGFPGNIYPVNPGGGEVDGLTCYPSLADLPGTVDCALIVIPAAGVVEVVRECAAAGVRSIIVGASGFAELGTPEGVERQRLVSAIARAAGMVVLGPNTNGILNVTDHLSLGYNTSHGELIDEGPISIASHSGALFTSLARRLSRMGTGLSKFVPVGNEADLSILDFLEYFIQDPATGVIGLVLESLADGSRFRRLCRQAQLAGKPIVVLKIGRSGAGAGATLAHSTRLAGSNRAYEALFRECGVGVVRSVEALAGGAALLARRTGRDSMHPQSLLCVSSSGAGAGLLADMADDRDIPLAGGANGEWTGTVAQALSNISVEGPLRNPLDTGVLGGHHDALSSVFEALEQGGVTGPLVLLTHSLPRLAQSQAVARAVTARRERTGSLSMVIAPGGLEDEVEAIYRASGVLVYYDSMTAFDSLECHYMTLENITPDEPPDAQGTADTARGLCLSDAALQVPAGGQIALSESESGRILRKFAIPVIENQAVRSADEAVAAGNRLGFPVALKAQPPGIAHKLQAGLVMLDLQDVARLQTAFARMEARIGELGFDPASAAIIVQPMVPFKLEVIVGLTREPGIGHFLLAGVGGVHAELLDQVVVMPVPVSPATIRKRIQATLLARMLQSIVGPRHAERHLDEIANALVSLQEMSLQYGPILESVDVNPLLVTSEGCVAVDALIVFSRAARA